MAMNPRVLTFALCVFSALATGCSTTEGRIKDHQAAFQSLPPEQQQKIRAGEVDVGFSQEMVVMALGEPDRRYTRTAADGTTEVWAYRSKAPALSFGIGVGGGGGGTAVGGGVGISTGDRSDDRLRVLFKDGRVIALERAGKR
jgi:predicted small secreted protein